MLKLTELTHRTFTIGGPVTSEMRHGSAGFDGSSDLEASSVCVICLNDFLPGESVRELHCHHVFHSACFERWLVLGHPLARCPLRCLPVQSATSVQPAMLTSGWQHSEIELEASSVGQRVSDGRTQDANRSAGGAGNQVQTEAMDDALERGMMRL